MESSGFDQPSRSFSEEEVSVHDTADNAWVIHNQDVFDVTEFLDKHPGGADIILPHLGRSVDNVLLDETSHTHSKAAFSLLETYKIGSIATSNNNEHKHSNGISKPNGSVKLKGWEEERVDWSKAMLPQVHLLGYDYKTWVHSPVDYKLQLFQSEFFEFFSKTPWYFVPIIWIPVVMYWLYLSWHSLLQEYVESGGEVASNQWMLRAVTTGNAALLFVTGLVFWTICEYILHRFLFHLDPKGNSPFLITLHFFLHGQHHKVPFDNGRLVFPPVAAGFFAVVFHLCLSSFFRVAIRQALFSGTICGYILYDLTHYYLHHGSPRPGTYLYRLKQYHIAHHFEDQERGFGISSKLWDYPFHTTFKKKVS